MKVELKDAVKEATISYRFAFSKDYDWTLGGKLPGLSSIGKCPYSVGFLEFAPPCVFKAMFGQEIPQV